MSSVSVIIPSFNHVRWLSACLDSCLEQELLKEIIIVDNGSTDGSLELIQRYVATHPGLIFLYQNTGQGANTSRNLGFSKSTGEYIQWLDSDDRLLPGKFMAQVHALEATRADVVYSDWQMDFYDETSGAYIRTEFKKNEAYPDFLFEILLNKRWSSPNAYLFTRKMAGKLHQVQAWNPQRKVEQDREYVSRAAIMGASFVYCSGYYAIYNRWSRGSISKMSFRQRLEHSTDLAKSLIKEIEQTSIPTKEKYISVLKTELLVSNYYHPSLVVGLPITKEEIYWPMVHWKLRPILFLKLLFGFFK